MKNPFLNIIFGNISKVIYEIITLITSGNSTSSNEVKARFATASIPGQASGNGWQNSAIGDYVSRVGNLTASKIGPNTLLKVMAGDQVSATTMYYYQNPVVNTGSSMIPQILSSLAQAITGSGVTSGLTKGAAGDITSQLTGSIPFGMKADPDAADASGNAPKAYLSVLFFDERFNFVQEGSMSLRVSQSGTGAAALVLANIKAPKNGYAYVYVSNSSDEMVYFDNLQVSHNRGRIIEENHYYAYGLKIAGISSRKLADVSEGHIENKDLYNDKELMDDADLDWYDYGFRSYDPQIGRFPQLDPLTDEYSDLTPYQYGSDDPITNIDVDGLEGAAATGGIVGDVFQNSKAILQAAAIVTPKLAPAAVKVGLSGTQIALTGIKIAANLVRIQVMTGTLNQGLSTKAVHQQLEKQMNDLVIQNVGLSMDDEFNIAIQAKKYFNGLNLMAWWVKGEFAKLDGRVIGGGEGRLSDEERVSAVEEGIGDKQEGAFDILHSGRIVGEFIASIGLFPEVGAGPRGSMLKFRTLPPMPRKLPMMEDVTALTETHYLTRSKASMQELVDEIRVDGIKESIKYVKLNGKKYIVDGHHRFFAALRLGIRKVPVEEVTLPYNSYRTSLDFMLEGKMPGYWKYIK